MKTTMLFTLLRLDNADKCLRWINKKHYRNEAVPLDAIITDEHKTAAHRCQMGRHLNLSVSLEADGSFSPLSLQFEGKTYELIEKK